MDNPEPSKWFFNYFLLGLQLPFSASYAVLLALVIRFDLAILQRLIEQWFIAAGWTLVEGGPRNMLAFKNKAAAQDFMRFFEFPTTSTASIYHVNLGIEPQPSGRIIILCYPLPEDRFLGRANPILEIASGSPSVNGHLVDFTAFYQTIKNLVNS